MSSKLSVAVLHMSVDVGIKDFIKSVEEFVINSKSKGAQLVVVPANLHPLIGVMKGSKKFSTYESYMADLINKFLGLSNKVVVYLLISPVIYRAGSRKYLASALITPQGKISYIKKVFGEDDLNINVSPGRDVDVLDIHGIKLCPLIGSDINVPEISRMCNYLGSDAILSVQLPRLTTTKDEVLKSILISRAVENSIPIINLGSYLGDGINLVPTLLINSSGDVLDIYDSFEPSVFIVEVIKRKVMVDKSVVKHLKNIIKFLIT